MTNSFKGGRGKVAPYNTKVVRVPEPILSEVQTLIDNYRQGLINDNSSTNSDYVPSNTFNSTSLPSLEQALILASQIRRRKQSASYSMVKLLQVLYNDKSITKEDIK